MLPRGLGGVVDSNLKVYGTSNVRVVDLSIAPLMPSAHTQALACTLSSSFCCLGAATDPFPSLSKDAIAEKAADLIP